MSARRTLGGVLIGLLALLPACRTADAARDTAAEASASASAGASAEPSVPPPGPTTTPPFALDREVDVVIAGGTVVDGTGAPGVLADVVVDDGAILHVGATAPSLRAERRVEAKGLVVTPGFVDLHAHGDPTNPSRNYLAMGVTTICVGQDGRSQEGDRIVDLARRHGKKRLAVNVAPLVGHGTARDLTGVRLATAPTPAEVAKLVRFVEDELAAGAFGLSTGLEYLPGARAPREELVALAKAVAEVDGVVMSHLRSEDDDAIDDAIDELVAQGEGGGARVHVAHLKVVYGKGVERAERLLGRLAEARARGVRITADAYPYEASYTTIGIVFPDYAKPPHRYATVRRERHEELAAFLRERVGKRGGPEATLFGTAPYRGKTLAEVARLADEPFEEVLLGLGPNGASAAFFVMDPALQARLLLDPWVMVGTDGAHASQHPRAHGTFARVLRELVVLGKRLPLEAAVHKMSGRAAETLRLDAQRRGRLAPGFAADVLVFDPAEVKDEATYTKPQALARGMRWVFVGGKAAIADGAFTKARGGRLLLRR